LAHWWSYIEREARISGTARVLQRGFRTSATSMIPHTEGTRMTGTLLVLYRRRHMINWWYYTKRDHNEWHIGAAKDTGISSTAIAVALHTERDQNEGQFK
jgi:hypothetical protein